MIINTGCRTDIPAFYSKWLMNRIREGFVLVRNPYYPSQVIKYNLSSKVVDCFAFCTKNPKPMLKYLDELDIYKQYWFVTIIPFFINKDFDVEKHIKTSFLLINTEDKVHFGITFRTIIRITIKR